MKNINENLDSNLEIAEVPEINIQKEPGYQLMALALKANNPGWGGDAYRIVKQSEEYYKENPDELEKIKNFFSSIMKDLKNLKSLLAKEGLNTDEEAVLLVLAATYKNEERKANLDRMVKEDKIISKYFQEIKRIQDNIYSFLDYLQESLAGTDLKKDLDDIVEKDINQRIELLSEIQSRIKYDMDFFRPRKDEYSIGKVSLIPTNFFHRKNFGRAFSIGNEHVISSNIDNMHNLEHEFVHSFFNSIIEKLYKKLSLEQQEKILAMASARLKEQEGEFGGDAKIILCEEFIRTFGSCIREGEIPEEDNQLSKLILDCYQDYMKISKNNQETNFEDFILDNFTRKLSNY